MRSTSGGKRIAYLVMAAGLTLVSGRVLAQTSVTGSIAGTVKDATGAVLPGVTVYNLFNANTVLSNRTTYGSTWLTPTAILGARLFKFGGQLDF